MADPKRQWKRHAQVLIGKAGGGLLAENLRIEFEVVKTAEKEPNPAVIKIYNLAPGNEAKVKNEFDEVILNAGYEGAMQIVFRGNIKHVYRYREKTDLITEIEAGDGDMDFRNAIINETLASGTTNLQLLTRVVASFKSTSGGLMQVKDRARLRGKVISGNTRNVLDDVAQESDANWSIQDGRLTIVQTDSLLPGEAILITSDTGMLGTPEINDKGVAVRCLLNPLIRVNGAIKLDNNGIKAKRAKAQALASAEEKDAAKQKTPVRLSPDGIYKVLKVTHRGDTHGKDWVSEIECIGMGQKAPGKKK